MIGFKAGVGARPREHAIAEALRFRRAPTAALLGARGALPRHLRETNPASLALGLGALALLLARQALVPRTNPVALSSWPEASSSRALFDLGALSVHLLGGVPTGLPTPALPRVQQSDINELLPLAFACFLLGAVETSRSGARSPPKHGYRFDANQEFLALGAANLAAGLGAGLPGERRDVAVARQRVRRGADAALRPSSPGARPRRHSVSVRAARGPAAAGARGDRAVRRDGALKLATLRRLWRAHRSEFFVAMAALAGVLGSGLLRGVLIGSILSLLLLIRRASQPHVAFLGRIPRTDRFSDIERHPGNEPVPGALLFRVDSGIVYFNVEAVRDAVWARVNASQEPIRLAVCDLSAAPLVDMAGAEMIAGLAREFAARGIAFRVVEARASVRDVLRLEGLEQLLGPISRRTTLAQAVEDVPSEDGRHVTQIAKFSRLGIGSSGRMSSANSA